MIIRTPLTITIPDGVRFADLKLARDPQTGDLEFEWAPLERICEASGIDLAVFRDAPEDNVAALLVAWYHAALANGEPRDPVQDDLIAEARAEDARGGGYSHQPGRA